MDELQINYIGEWYYTGLLGHLLTIISLSAALLATLSYFRAAQLQSKLETGRSDSWKKLGRISFGITTIAVMGIIAILFYLILSHRFEYHYIYERSSTSMPIYYVFSCFWSGQEGSFLLWSFWTVILGALLIRWANKWENYVMTVFSLMQLFLASMLIGIYFFGYKVGSSPFILFRDVMPHLPVFANPNYASLIQDGNGLNPLLQNYWMVIHPPTLFLGFAACLVPFAYVIAGLWRQEYGKDWVLPTLKWSLFTAAILGTGILMGGAWAYESLSFGGFWAWDPVENASLVPWITLIGGIHTLLAYKHSGYALRITNILLLASLLLILYSSFLTRSGVLGDTSVHSFVDLGMSGQLLIFLLSFVALSVVLLTKNWSSMPNPKKEESAYSREFWMFVGALILTLLAVLIAIDTSWPVINSIIGTERTIEDPIAHYNQYTIWFAIVISLLSASIQYLRYKESNLKKFLQKLIIAVIVSAVLTAAIAYSMEIHELAYVLFLFFATYVVVANINYILAVLKGKIKVAGGSVAHIGFGLILLGTILSLGKKEVISLNRLGIHYGEGFDNESSGENVLLYENNPIRMDDYFVTYIGDTLEQPLTVHKVKFEKKQRELEAADETFTLRPNTQLDPQNNLLPNPDARHYWNKDVFVYITSIPDKSKQTEEYKELEMGVGDTALVGGKFIALKKINPEPLNTQYLAMPGDIAAGAMLEVRTMSGKKYAAEPVYFIRHNKEESIEAEIEDLGLTFTFQKIFPETGKVQIGVEDKERSDFIIMKAMIFPYINILWLGCLVMVVGFFMSMMQRNREGKR